MEKLKVDLKLQALPVEITDKEGKAHDYELREMDGDAQGDYLDSIADKMKYDKEGKPCGLKTFKGLKEGLLNRCLFDSEGKVVTMKELKQFPGTALTVLFEAAQKLSGLDLESKEGIKNG